MEKGYVCSILEANHLTILTSSRWCQGLSLALDPKSDWDDGISCSLPFLIPEFLDSGRDPIEETIQLHLQCSKRLGGKSANPYYDLDNGFHIVFYEKITTQEIPESESWKTGKLYPKAAKGEVEAFRRSAFTVSPCH